jgi:hypothetical protein
MAISHLRMEGEMFHKELSNQNNVGTKFLNTVPHSGPQIAKYNANYEI